MLIGNKEEIAIRNWGTQNNLAELKYHSINKQRNYHMTLKICEEIGNNWIYQSIGPRSIKQCTKYSDNQWIKQPINQTINKSIHQSIYSKVSADWHFNKWISGWMNVLVSQWINKYGNEGLGVLVN